MKNLKKIRVEVTYKVGLGDIEMPENVYKEIIESVKNNHRINSNDSIYIAAAEWLTNNIRERDCFDWEIEINDILCNRKKKN